MIDVVMPLHPGKGDLLDLLRAASCIGSFVASGSEPAIGNYFVVYPRGHRSLTTTLCDLSPKVRLVYEDELFSTREYAAIMTFGGWRRQQFIKLAASRLSDPSAFLACDADVTNINRVEMDACVKDGRVLYQAGSQIRKWVEASFALVGAERPQNFMSVTPTFLSPAGLRHMHDFFGRSGSRNWVVNLSRSAEAGVEWTEYTLYQAVLVKLGLWDGLHFRGAGYPINQGIWRRSLDNSALIEKLQARRPMFFVYQSTREDFFLSQKKLAAAGMPTLATLPMEAQRDVQSALLEHHEVRRYWNKAAEPSLGRFRTEYTDLLRTMLCGGPALSQEETFVALTIMWLGATLVAERLIDKERFKETSNAAAAAMRAWAPLRPVIDESADFQTLLRVVQGAKEVLPSAIAYILAREDTSRPLFRHLLVRMRSGSVEDLLAILDARIERRRVPMHAVTDIAVWLSHRDLGRALSLMRRNATTFRNRPHFWRELAKIWTTAKKPEAAARATERSERVAREIEALQLAERQAEPVAA
ncbi:DUF6492 family protein [Sphingomonas sp. ID0503]|uniref:DUF6492 family protein n=1 Tax=Sphingomonas sp. ID0503 TaxID=3399691 RepID=UPI003AFA1036